VDVKVNGKTVTAVIHLDEGRPASTGKSTILYTTNGYVPIGKGMRISINIIAPNDKDFGAPVRQDGDREDGPKDKNKNSLCPQRGS